MHLLVSFVSLSSVSVAGVNSKGGGFETVLDERVWSWGLQITVRSEKV